MYNEYERSKIHAELSAKDIQHLTTRSPGCSNSSTNASTNNNVNDNAEDVIGQVNVLTNENVSAGKGKNASRTNEEDATNKSSSNITNSHIDNYSISSGMDNNIQRHVYDAQLLEGSNVELALYLCKGSDIFKVHSTCQSSC